MYDVRSMMYFTNVDGVVEDIIVEDDLRHSVASIASTGKGKKRKKGKGEGESDTFLFWWHEIFKEHGNTTRKLVEMTNPILFCRPRRALSCVALAS